HAHDAAVDVALLLGQVVAVGERDLDPARLDEREARADERHGVLAAEAVAHAGGEVHGTRQATLRLRKRQLPSRLRMRFSKLRISESCASRSACCCSRLALCASSTARKRLSCGR